MPEPRRFSGPPRVGAAVKNEPKKPGCPNHMTGMKFDTNAMVWRCQEANCHMVAYPKEDVDAGKGKPKVGRGILELVKAGNSWYLRAPDDNVMIEVTSYLGEARQVRDGTVILTLSTLNLLELPDE